MKKFKLIIIILLLIAITFIYAGTEKTISKVFDGKKIIKINTISGDCAIEKSKDSQIYIELIYTYNTKNYITDFIEEGNILTLKENFKGSSRGKSLWKIKIPEKLNIIFNSASGDLEISNLKLNLESNTASGDFKLNDIIGDIEIATASGDLKLYNLNGKLSFHSASGDMSIKNINGNIIYITASGDLKGKNINGNVKSKSASGDIDLKKIEGAVKIKTASGEIRVQKISFKGESYCKTASGDIDIKLMAPCEHNLTISTASGDLNLDYNGHEIHGSFTLITKNSNVDEISTPFNIDTSEVYKEWGKKMVKKTIILKSKTPKIKISSYSGDIKIRK